MFTEIGMFEYHPAQRARFVDGSLRQKWCQQYPLLFDKEDQLIAEHQPRYHFFEWLAAILLYNCTGYLSLVEQYEFRRHARKQRILRKLLSSSVLELIYDRQAYKKTQCPDLLVYAPDMSDWFFCEVKGPQDRLQSVQKEYFEALAKLSEVDIRIIRFRKAKA